MNIVIPMAGLGTRFSSEGFDVPKPLIEVGGKTLIEHSIDSLNLNGRYIFITRKIKIYIVTYSKKSTVNKYGFIIRICNFNFFM